LYDGPIFHLNRSSKDFPVNVLHLSAYDIKGGAARAAYRLHQGLKSSGVNSRMLVQEKSTHDYTVIGPKGELKQGLARGQIMLDKLPLKLMYRQRPPANFFSLQWFPERAYRHIQTLQPDIINLHWIGSGFVQPQTIARLQQPLVWTLHDMWPFTGGCHYTGSCEGYRQSCGACPALKSHQDQDITRWQWLNKSKAWPTLNLTIVTPSEWLANCARSSSLLRHARIEVIPNGLDLQTYRPIPQLHARELMQFPTDKKLLLFSAMDATSDPRKGFKYLQLAIQALLQAGWGDRLELVVLGASSPAQPVDLGLKVHYLGNLSDDLALAAAYSAVDAMVITSLQDNLPNVVIEAMACGTPCIGFKLGGIPDMIDHGVNGYLANPLDVHDLANGISWVLTDPDRLNQLSHQARVKTEQAFSLELQAQRYQKLYQDLLSTQPPVAQSPLQPSMPIPV
jgi:glycosyltransferase involved in cell wall biosynthesis